MAIEQPLQSQKLPIKINVIITTHKGNPCIELRRKTTDTDLIKALVSAAFHRHPIILYPEFTDTIASIASLIDKGIIYYDQETQQYYYTI